MIPPKNQLPDFLIADLYRNNLVILEEEVPKTAKPAKKHVPAAERKWYLGDNAKKIIILVNEPEAVYLPDASLQFLSSILHACKLNLGDIAIVNFQNDPVSYQFLKEKLMPIQVLLFGVSAKKLLLPFMIPDYQVQKHDNCSFLQAPALETMMGDSKESKLEKSKLWLSLKKMFGI